ncbi:PEGA domain-containing protein [bacterium]|nr:PEGA domain-containing protein [bacterium]
MNKIHTILILLIISQTSIFGGGQAVAAELVENDPLVYLAILPILSDVQDIDLPDSLHIVIAEVIGESEILSPVDQSKVDSFMDRWTQENGQGCIAVSCMNSIGRELEVGLVISCAMQQIRNKVAVEIRAVDVGKQQLIAHYREEFTTGGMKYETMLQEASLRLLDYLLLPPAMIYVDTDPPNSRIEINNEPAGIAPLSLALPTGHEYTFKAVRQGYENKIEKIYFEPGDSVYVKLKMSEVQELPKNPVSIRLMASGGLPFNHSSSNIDTRLALGDGHSYGFAAAFGETWRFKIGTFSYTNISDGLDAKVWRDYGAVGVPEISAQSFHSSLIYSRYNPGLSGFIGAGMGTIRQSIRVELEGGEKQEKKSDYLVGLMMHAGVELGFTRSFAMQFEILHTRLFSDNYSATFSEDATPEEIAEVEFWNETFRSFTYLTVFRLNILYRI